MVKLKLHVRTNMCCIVAIAHNWIDECFHSFNDVILIQAMRNTCLDHENDSILLL